MQTLIERVKYDPIEVTVESVLVEIAQDSGGNPSKWFTEHFLANAGKDPDHYANPGEVIAFGGLSHNTLNLLNRNIEAGMPGCACHPPRFETYGLQVPCQGFVG